MAQHVCNLKLTHLVRWNRLHLSDPLLGCWEICTYTGGQKGFLIHVVSPGDRDTLSPYMVVVLTFANPFAYPL